MAAELGRASASHAVNDVPALHLLNGPYAVVDGDRHELPEGSKRLVVLVTLSGGRLDRRTAAGMLWPDGDDVRAAGNLRSALWRLRGAGIDVVDSDKAALRLRVGTAVDLHEVSDRAGRLIEGPVRRDDLDTADPWPDAGELLPGWFDDWVVFERERLRQRLLHGLEALSRLLVRAQRAVEAVDAARAAVRMDPLRESGRRTLVAAQLAAGDPDGARRTYDTYCAAAFRALGVQPSAELTALACSTRPPTLRSPASPAGDRWAARTCRRQP